MKVVLAISLVVFLSLVCGSQANINNATLVLLEDAAKPGYGAMCLDGTPTGYYIRKGEGDGAKKWILHLGGGGWCNNSAVCYNRSLTWLGSSKDWPKSESLDGFLSDNKSVNPDFYNWNVVYMMYCDGASFSNELAQPVVYNKTKLYFRGRRNLRAQLKDMRDNKGLNVATDVILSGCSAGGLAVYLHADAIRMQFPKTVKFRAFPDAGYFVDIKSYKTGENTFRDKVNHTFHFQNCSGGVNQECLKAMKKNETWKCFFAPYSFKYIRTPIFVLNSVYDTAQLRGIYNLPCLPPNCTEDEMRLFDYFREVLIAQADPVLNSPPTNGYFFDSCLVHCQTLYDETWTTYAVGRYTIREAFANWYKGKGGSRGSNMRLIDCDNYPCNPTCPKAHEVHEEKSVEKVIFV